MFAAFDFVETSRKIVSFTVFRSCSSETSTFFKNWGFFALEILGFLKLVSSDVSVSMFVLSAKC